MPYSFGLMKNINFYVISYLGIKIQQNKNKIKENECPYRNFFTLILFLNLPFAYLRHDFRAVGLKKHV